LAGALDSALAVVLAGAGFAVALGADFGMAEI
jgi:hypothetical protein